jgi:hypothetical protein
VVEALCYKPEGRGFTQPLTYMSSRSRKIMVLGNKARPVRKADNLTAIKNKLRGLSPRANSTDRATESSLVH